MDSYNNFETKEEKYIDKEDRYSSQEIFANALCMPTFIKRVYRKVRKQLTYYMSHQIDNLKFKITKQCEVASSLIIKKAISFNSSFINARYTW